MRFGYVWQVSSWQKVLNKLRYFCLSLWRRLGENYPENYFSLILQGPTLYVVRFVGNHAVQETCFDISQNDFHNVNEILNKFPDYPLQILLHGEDSQFRLVSLKRVRWWDCAPLLKQAKENEFSNTDWHQTQPAGCRQDRYRYLLMGLHPSLYLQKLIKNLQSQANPVFGLQLWSVVLAHMIFENLRQQRLDHSLKEWTLILHQLDKDYWQLIVCQNQGIVLTRQGPLNKTLSKHSLAQEILTTLRYLNRKDYKEGEPVTVITSGFDTPLVFEDIPELQVITLDQHYDKKTRTLNYFSIRRQLYSYFTRKQPTLAAFERPELRLHRLAFSLPQYFISLGVPSILFLVLGSFLLFGYNYSYQKEYAFLLQQQAGYLLPADIEKKLQTGKLFHAYQTLTTYRPVPILRNLVKVMTPYGVATEIKWHTFEKGAGLVYSHLDINLTLDNRFFDKLIHPTMGKTTLNDYQKKIEKFFTKGERDVSLQWEPSVTKSTLNLRVEYPEKSSKESVYE